MQTEIYRSELDKLTERAKRQNPEPEGLNLGEKFFVTLLHLYIEQYRTKEITESELLKKKKELEDDLMIHWDLQKIFKNYIDIAVKHNMLITQAEKEGCPICKKLIRIFDGRES
ncbi:MAG: hypothetical protein ACI4IS_00275 [Acutalibacteraceae bacterium]